MEQQEGQQQQREQQQQQKAQGQHQSVQQQEQELREPRHSRSAAIASPTVAACWTLMGSSGITATSSGRE